jgi:hypothetical protein
VTEAIRNLGARFGENEDVLRQLGNVLLDLQYPRSARNEAFLALNQSREAALPFLRAAFHQVDDKTKLLIMTAFKDGKDLKAIPLLETLIKAPETTDTLRRNSKLVLKHLKSARTAKASAKK